MWSTAYSTVKPRFAAYTTHKPVVAALDIDLTLIPWRRMNAEPNELALQQTSRTLHDPAVKPKTFLMLNTGRGLLGIQAIANLLKKFPVDALGLNDGQQLFVRQSSKKAAGLNSFTHDDSPANVKQWLLGLSQQDACPVWQKNLNGWSTPKVIKDMQDHLTTQGYQHTLDAAHKPELNEVVYQKPLQSTDPGDKGVMLLIKLFPDQAYFYVTRSDNKPDKAALMVEAHRIAQSFKADNGQKWPQFTYFLNTPLDNVIFIHVGPENTHKGALVTHLAQQLGGPKAIVSAGDSLNDKDVLAPDNLGHLPNYPIMVGNHAGLKAHLDTHKPTRLFITAADKLHEGLTTQFNRLAHLHNTVKPKSSDLMAG